jgi:hypothetical protein
MREYLRLLSIDLSLGGLASLPVVPPLYGLLRGTARAEARDPGAARPNMGASVNRATPPAYSPVRRGSEVTDWPGLASRGSDHYSRVIGISSKKASTLVVPASKTVISAVLPNTGFRPGGQSGAAVCENVARPFLSTAMGPDTTWK